ncbi:hypothetical protein [Actinomadura gamaensis]|uniref:Uncharacterized protein n=1 Tax=Actinomadura gamaensis TaxID=1763541 RepID=A0ABV9TUG4_9ACTN
MLGASKKILLAMGRTIALVAAFFFSLYVAVLPTMFVGEDETGIDRLKSGYTWLGYGWSFLIAFAGFSIFRMLAHRRTFHWAALTCALPTMTSVVMMLTVV